MKEEKEDYPLEEIPFQEEEMVDLKEIAGSLIKGKTPQIKELVKKALDEGVDKVKELLKVA